jgi:hypothetical protein
MNSETTVNGSLQAQDAQPCLKIYWDAERQDVRLEFNTQVFRTWSFVQAILDMAKAAAESQQKMAQLAAMQQQQQQARQAEAVRRHLHLG